MDAALITSLQSWQTFYVLLGTATATLLGLLFVALSLGSGEFYEAKTSVVFSIFVEPVYHLFLAALIVSVLVLIPIQTALSLTIELLVLVLYNAIHHARSARVAIARRQILYLEARVTAVILPIISSVAILLAALSLPFNIPFALALLAGASFFSLFLGIINTWQVTTWIIQQKNKVFDEKKS